MDRWKDYIKRIRKAYTENARYPLPAYPMDIEYMDDMVVVWCTANGTRHVAQVYVEEEGNENE